MQFSQRKMPASNASTWNESESYVQCKQRFIMTSIEKNLIEGIVWMLVAVVSSILNAAALRSLTRKFKLKKVHQLYLGNVFLCNCTTGSLVYICSMLIKFSSNICVLRDICVFGTIVFTNVNQLSMIFILTSHIRNRGGTGFSLTESNRITIAKVQHIIAILGSWLFSGLLLLMIIFKPEANVILIYTFCKTVCIIALGLYAAHFIRKGNRLRKKNEIKGTNETAIIIIVVFLIVTVATWFPLLTVLALQKFKLVQKDRLVQPLLIATRILFLGPLIDPILYFWSKKKNKVSSLRKTAKNMIKPKVENVTG